MFLKITFEDHDQDFLEWLINHDGEIVKCEPFQRTVWCGNYVINKDELKVGGRVQIFRSGAGHLTIKYPIESLELLDEQGAPLPDQQDIAYH